MMVKLSFRLLALAAAFALAAHPALAAPPTASSSTPSLPIGTAAGTAAAGNDPRVVAGGTAVQPATDVGTNTIGGVALSKVVPVPDSTGASPLLSPDGSVGAKFGYQPFATSPVDFIRLLPGQYGGGATVLCDGEANSPCTFVARGTGGHTFGNGNGIHFQTIDPGAPVGDIPTLTPPSNANSTFAILSLPGSFNTAWQINGGGSAGVGIGQGNKAFGLGCVAAGYNSQCYGQGSFAGGYGAYDIAYSRSHVWSSGNPSGAYVNSVTQTLFATTTGAASARLSEDGATVTHVFSLPVEVSAAASFDLIVQAKNGSATDVGTWYVHGAISRLSSGNAVLDWKSGDGTLSTSQTGPGTTLTGASLAVAIDTTNSNLSVTGTGISGVGIVWSARANWIMRQN